MTDRRLNVPLALASASLLMGLAVFIYWRAAGGHFFNDDYGWLSQTFDLSIARFVDISHYSHFYRPVIEVYFGLGLALFGCDPLPFHWLNVAIHVLTAGALYLFAREVGMPRAFAYFGALWFTVQSGPVEAVAWIGAITDLLPGLWYILGLWTFAAFLYRRQRRFYVATLFAFAACLLTHESSATLVAMLAAVDVMLQPRGPVFTRDGLRQRFVWYLPFALMAVGYLALEYNVNSRSYLVTEGHYRFGLHAWPNLLNYFVAMLVWQRSLAADIVMVGGALAALVFGTPRLRFFMTWVLVSILPVLFFTWGISGRYEYIPSAGVSMLAAELLHRWYVSTPGRVPMAARTTAMGVIALFLIVRSTGFAREGSEDQRALSEPYRVLAAAVLTAPRDAEGRVIVDPALIESIPPNYVDAAVRVSFCRADVRSVVGVR